MDRNPLLSIRIDTRLARANAFTDRLKKDNL